jgi:hypothetical protein
MKFLNTDKLTIFFSSAEELALLNLRLKSMHAIILERGRGSGILF